MSKHKIGAIPTCRRNIAQRLAARLWQACDDRQWLPLAIAFVLLVIVNSVDKAGN